MLVNLHICHPQRTETTTQQYAISLLTHQPLLTTSPLLVVLPLWGLCGLSSALCILPGWDMCQDSGHDRGVLGMGQEDDECRLHLSLRLLHPEAPV